MVNIKYGSFYNSMGTTAKGANNPGWGNNYVSTNSLVPLTFCSRGSSNSAGNVFKHVTSSSNVVLHNNLSGYPYTLSVPDGYTITGYTITGTSTGATPTATGGGISNTFGSVSSSLVVTGLSTQSTTFTVTNCGDASSDANCLTCQISVTVSRDAEYILRSRAELKNKITSSFTSDNSNIVVWKILATGSTNEDGLPTYTFQNSANSKYATCTPEYSNGNTIKLSWSETATGHYTYIITQESGYIRIRPSDATGTTGNKDNKTSTYWTTWGNGSGNIVFWFFRDNNYQTDWLLERIPAAAASIQTTKCYNIMNLRGLWAVGNGATDINSTYELSLSWDVTDTKQQFAFVKYNSKNYLYSVSEEKFAYLDGNKLSLTPYFTDEVAASNITLAASTNANKSFYPAIITIQSAHLGVSTGKSPDVFKYTDAADEGNASLIVEAGDFDATDAQAQITNTKKVTYKLTFNGTVFDSYNTDVYEFVGATATAPTSWSLPTNCSTGTCTPSTIGVSTTEVLVEMNWTGPFDFSSSFNDATWYYMKVNGKYAIKESSFPYTLSSDKEDAKNNENALWGFMGDPINGIKVINRAAGEDYYLNAWDYYGHLVMTTYDEDYCLWKIKYNVASGFTLDNANYVLNDENEEGKLKAVGNSLENNIFYASTSSITLEYPYADMALAELETYVSGHALGEYFGVDETLYNSTKTSIESMSSSFNKAAYNNVVNHLADLTRYPSDGHYYRIKNNGTGDYIAYGQPAAQYNEKTPGLIAISSDDAATDASSVIKLTGSAGTYKLSTEDLNVQSQTTGSQAFPATNATGADFVFNIATPGIVSITNAASRVDDNNDGSLHNATDWTVNGVVNWRASDANSKWVVEDATDITLTLNAVDGKTYGTTYLPFGVTLPSGGAAGNDVCAYTLTDNGNGWLTLNLLGEDGKSIPAGTPVLLKGTTSTSVIATIADVEALDPAPTNALSGTYLQMDHGDNLVLGKKDGVVGFYKYNFDIKANKAYIANASNVRGFILMDDDDATGIGSLTPTLSEGEEAVIYNMAGQRVSKAQKGIYIVNGKKILK